ncbi:MAG: universal stress protein [Deltaproteobacteria bacterium]|jgi:nucleotide-binding universal stress UspA family protein|nr:universal stress protein [Deltaproteobacteria bacterium]MBT4264475.1 universal stress protein [Deltaproteobacteria bacterium]MBT4641785.1 universal stress protein [Deltaproteobacteria bacterium]MBT6498722.1 universal stress protein [Deltaproteobacteria bacterium]MBT6611927.1 universal stress protein [Deltaproteobacteria bacterium]
MSQNNSKQMSQDMLTNKNQIKRILYATDLTKSAPKVYQYVLFLAKQFNAEIVCLHVVDHFSQQPSMNFAGYYLTEEDKQKVVHQETQKSLEEMARRNRQAFICQQIGTEGGLYPEQLELTIENKVVFGNTEEQVLKQSINSNCDLIVMGAHEKPRFTFTTTLSKRVMQRSKVPVAVVPLPGERKEQSTGFLPSFLPYFPAAQ